MKLSFTTFMLGLSLLLFASCSGFYEEDLTPASATNLSLLNANDGSRQQLSGWQQSGCDSSLYNCSYSSVEVGADSLKIQAKATFYLPDSLNGENFSFSLTFSRLLNKRQEKLTEYDGIRLFDSPESWWTEFFLNSNWITASRSASLAFVSPELELQGTFGENEMDFLTVRRVNRVEDPDGSQWAIMEGSFGITFPVGTAGLGEPIFQIENGNFVASFPLD